MKFESNSNQHLVDSVTNLGQKLINILHIVSEGIEFFRACIEGDKAETVAGSFTGTGVRLTIIHSIQERSGNCALSRPKVVVTIDRRWAWIRSGFSA